MIVKLSLGLSWFPLPPDNVLPRQGVTSLANCPLSRGLKARGRPGRAGANPGIIGPSDCSQRHQGTSPGSPPSAPHRQPHAPCSVPADFSSIDSSEPPAMAEGRVLGMLCPQHAGGVKGFSLRAACSETGAKGRESRISLPRRDPKFCPGSRRHQGCHCTGRAWEALLGGTGDLVLCSGKGG